MCSRCWWYCATSSGEVQKQISRMMDWGVRWSIARRWCGVSDSDLMLLRGMPSASAVVCARREANWSSSVVASSDTIASVPLAWGLGWALKWMSMIISSTVGFALLVVFLDRKT